MTSGGVISRITKDQAESSSYKMVTRSIPTSGFLVINKDGHNYFYQIRNKIPYKLASMAALKKLRERSRSRSKRRRRTRSRRG